MQRRCRFHSLFAALLLGICLLVPVSAMEIQDGGGGGGLFDMPTDPPVVTPTPEPEPPPATEPPAEPKPPKSRDERRAARSRTGTVEVGSSRLNVRDGPWGNIIGKLHTGDKVDIKRREGDWYVIDYQGKKAYVHSDYVRTDGKVPGGPAVGKTPAPAGPAPGGGQGVPPGMGSPVGEIPEGTGATLGQAKGDGTVAGAIEWARDQMPGGSGQGVNSNNGQSQAKNSHAWDSWCLAFVATAYGRAQSLLQACCAIKSADKFKAAGKLIASRNIPAGMPVFFAATSHNSGYGHICVATGKVDEKGDPIVITTGWNGYAGPREEKLSVLERLTGAYIGFGQI